MNSNIDPELTALGFRVRDDDRARTTLARIVGRLELGRDNAVLVIHTEVMFGRHRSDRAVMALTSSGKIRSIFGVPLARISEFIDMLETIEQEFEGER